MITGHLSETEVQEYALNKSTSGQEIVEHMKICAKCRADASFYQQLFTAIVTHPKPITDFDISSLVLGKINEDKIAIKPGNVYTLAFYTIIIFAIALALYFFRNNIFYLFNGISTLFLYLAIGSTVIVLFFKCTNMYKKYQDKMDMLNFS
ncbi:MAG TPA: hypothetical protein VGO09_00460 [Flavisolibacter sp.]|nr:hypothetical protein [Flavisolibacter sp.]